MDIASADVFPGTVLDVAADVFRQIRISGMFVGVDFAARFDVLDDLGMENLGAGAFDGKGDGLAAPFAHSENGLLADRSTSGVELLPFVLVGFLAADERLVDFNDALELSARDRRPGIRAVFPEGTTPTVE